MNIQNTFKQQRKLQNAFQKLIDSTDELPMDEAAKEGITKSLLEQFKSEAKKIVDKTELVEYAEEPELPLPADKVAPSVNGKKQPEVPVAEDIQL